MDRLFYYALYTKIWKGVKSLMANFQNSLLYGKNGEELVKKRLEYSGWVVTDVTENKEFQEDDIDLIIQKGDVVRTLEVKNSTRTLNSYGTIAVEDAYMYKRDYMKYRGWLWESKADYFVFTDTKNKKMYIIASNRLRKYVWTENYRQKKRIPMDIWEEDISLEEDLDENELHLLNDHVYDEELGYKKTWVYYIDIKDLRNKFKVDVLTANK